MKNKFVIATRKSLLALKQTELVKNHLATLLPHCDFEVLGLTTTGDEKREISLEKEGGKGLFTKEIEEALLENQADLAVHSAKDLPTESPQGLVLAGFLKRADPVDVLVLREGVSQPQVIATGSPRRRAQLQRIFPNATYTGFRGNVDTRLSKIVRGDADATVLAAAGLDRLGFTSYDGIVFQKLSLQQMVPAVGQGAIAIQCREADYDKFANYFDHTTRYAVEMERIFLASLGGGCQTAFAGHYNDGTFYVFHEKVGFRTFKIPSNLNINQVQDAINQVVNDLCLK